MQKFEELDKRKAPQVEKDILLSWGGSVNKILEESINQNKNNPNFVFYDGPIYANAKPGLHHLYGKNIKDCFCKYKTMQGFKVIRKMGLDTHGLPIEVNVEKKLGFNTKLDIENYGIDKFNEECKKQTDSNVDDVCNLTNLMGQFIDTQNPYITCTNNYIETEWWILKEMDKKGLLYNSNKVLPYCPRCGTELSAHEVAQNYKEIDVNSVYVPFKLKNEDTYALVWTTTPWTLLANVALCVNPNEEYIKVRSKNYNFLIASSLAQSVLGTDFEILEVYKGKDLEYVEYEQLIDSLKVDKKAFYITVDEYVSMSDGTGIVHIAPAFGVDDAKVGKNYDLPVLNPVGSDGKYKEGLFKGRFVLSSELELEIIKYLKTNDKLFKKFKMKHNYPHCWRCNTPLLYYAKPAWYIKTTAYKEQIVQANKKVNWYPAFVGEKRFANWLDNLVDWGISRNRYWGAPLPIWTCDCSNYICVGSIQELKDLAIEELNDEQIDLHRPYVDNIHIKCPKCSKIMNRVKDVLDVWFDSGVMPYAQYHYPFENQDIFNNQFPADFITEGIDQTRGWFYVLLVISTIIKGQSPYKNVLVNDMLLDKDGKKMSKSKGNVVDPFKALDEYGADVIRFYLLYVSPIWTPLKFDIAGIKEVYSKFFNPLRNTYNFFSMYANTDNIDLSKCKVEYNQREDIDKWLLSKYNRLIQDVTTYFEEYDLNKVVKALTNFVSEDLSNWYIRRNRNRFWTSTFNNSKKSVYITTYEVLVGLSQLIAPIVPYLSEEMYSKLTHDKSVHLSKYPQVNESLINYEIEMKMDLVRNLISIGRQAREQAALKVRQPLSKVVIDCKNQTLIADLVDLIKEELNVRQVVFEKDLSKYMNFKIQPNYKNAGPILGADIKEFSQFLKESSQEKIIAFKEGEPLKFKNYNISEDLIDIKIEAKDDIEIGMQNNDFVILDTNLTEELIDEGIAREFVSKVQNLRKEKDFDIADRIWITIQAHDDLQKSLLRNKDYIMNETLCTKFDINSKEQENKISINDDNLTITILKQNN